MADVYTRIGYIKGDTGATGATGAKGDQGDAATIEVGTVTTVPYGQTASVVNSGTSGAAVFDFTIPQGRPGQETTDMQNLVIGAITTSSASFPVPAVGETGKVLWGKVVKWFSDMAALVATKLDIDNVVNNLNTTVSGYVLDARVGKSLNDKINGLFKVKAYSFDYSGLSGGAQKTITASDFGMASPSGFVPFAIRRITTGSTNVVIRSFDVSAGGGSLALGILNTGSSVASGTVGFQVIYCNTLVVEFL